MQFQPIDVTAVVGTTLGILCFLVPVAGFTLRFAFKPLVEALAVAWGAKNANRQEIVLLEKRIALLERELELRRLPAVAEVPSPGATVAPLRSYERT
jgi:hypothetical protein